MQIAGIEGQVMSVHLIDQGLYMTSGLGSLRLSSSQIEMRKIRVLLERLFNLKRNLLYMKNCFQKLEFDKSSDSKSMERRLKIKRSPYESSSNESSDEELFDQEVSEEEISEEEISDEKISEEEVPSEEVSGVHKDTKYTG
ncbi:hypothetical protein G6F57_003033 [Rhizopus arrhizus]|uniref:Uncharacterized protein n=1 Tax=Rhizopus oryzae TaxID=64495 RepID=A0A9P6XBF9_RHIOR|nr:hypothetical protein G6F23_009950 [Rhizopus arrhizus]KAG0760099.1 hypothetical protein G6F24_008576 [Rhizopus arrhizus]KAG0785096.1 hypothetical protein G6F21_009482 [Rhizopus arrhizus]KAG0817215.1 hypothetical protein G6F20_002557 [Rhizopus arrhizus]KAG0824873.1 hypothetical protein G6F19_010108 [Rhizopus arrhizus]